MVYSMLKIGVLGSGRISELHLKAYKKIKGVKIVALCDKDQTKLMDSAKKWNIPLTFSDYKDLIICKEVDALDIVTPYTLNFEVLELLQKIKKPFSIQKPLCSSVKEAKTLVKKFKKFPKPFQLSENFLFYPPLLKAKKYLDEGLIGDPQLLKISFIGGAFGGWKIPSDAWKWRLEQLKNGYGMQTFDHGHHLISVSRFLFGELEKVFSWIDNYDGSVDCPALISLKHLSPAKYTQISYHFGREMTVPSDYYSNDEWIEISGTKGILFVERCSGKIKTGSVLKFFDGQEIRPLEDCPDDWQLSFDKMIENFIESIRGGSEPRPSFEFALENLKILEAIRLSSEKGKEIYVQEVDSKLKRTSGRVKRSAKKIKDKIPLAFKEEQLGDQAEELLFELVENYQVEPGGPSEKWESEIGLEVLADKKSEISQKFCLKISKGRAKLEKGKLAAKGKFYLALKANDWAHVLLKKKSIETVLLRGKVKWSGPTEEGLKLRSAFKL